jgi:hypothetical protein
VKGALATMKETPDIERMVAKLRDLNDQGELDDAEALLAEILETKDLRVLPLLLTMREYKDAEYWDEMLEVLREVETHYPAEPYLKSLVSLSTQLASASPSLFKIAVHHVLDSPEKTEILIRILAGLPVDGKWPFVDAVEEVLRDDDYKSKHQSGSAILERIK